MQVVVVLVIPQRYFADDERTNACERQRRHLPLIAADGKKTNVLFACFTLDERRRYRRTRLQHDKSFPADSDSALMPPPMRHSCS